MASDSIRLLWESAAVPETYQPMLRALALEYPIAEGIPSRDGDRALTVAENDSTNGYSIARNGDAVSISCGSLCALGRALGTVLAGGDIEEESLEFKTNGIMLDVSRNAAMKPDHFKGWLRRLCLMGYNLAMLYAEDTYQVPGEEYFGYLRGAYSLEDMQDLDAYAKDLGIEMMGCIQTLGHMEQVLKWSAYGEVRDDHRILLIDEEKTYDLIRKMVQQMSRAFGSRRLHVGMDEAYGMGRGEFLLKHGYQNPFEIFNRHIAKVIEICKEEGITPMIWGDMYSRIENDLKKQYGDDIPEELVNEVPEGVEVVFWNYYSPKESVYEESFQFYRDMGVEPIMGSGVWTWGQCFWYRRENTENNVAPCLRAMRKCGVDEVFFTMWGDDGAYCEYDSALAGLAFSAELCWQGDDADQEAIGRRFAAVCGADYEIVRSIADMNSLVGPATIMWDDPILRMHWKEMNLCNPGRGEELIALYRRCRAEARKFKGHTHPIDFDHIYEVLRLLIRKADVNLRLDAAYPKKDMVGLQAVIAEVPAVEEQIDRVLSTFRRQWYRRNRPHGFEVIQIRLAGLRIRYEELRTRLQELLDGEIETIPELDEVPTTVANKGHGWRDLASASCIV